MSAARPALSIGAHGVAIGWHGPLGPAIARFGSYARERPEAARALGRVGADRAIVPCLARDDAGLLVAWCEEDGAWACRVEGERVEPASLAIPGATAIALTGRTLFAADADGIVSVELDASGAPRSAPIRRLSEQLGGVSLAAASLREERLLVYAHPDDAAWGTIVVRGAAASVVRHRSEAPIESVHVEALGGRAGMALGLRGGEVRFAVIGAAGKIIERPHPIFARGADRLESPVVVWVERAFWVLARAPSPGAVRVQPVGGGEGFALPRSEGPFAAALYAEHLYALEVAPDGDAAELRLWRCDARGDAQQRRVSRVELEGAAARRACLDARATLEALGRRMTETESYRARRLRPVLAPGRAALSAHDATGRLDVSLAPREAGFALRVAHARGDDDGLVETPSPMARLARWVRLRTSAAARAEAARDEAWANELARAIDGVDPRLVRAGALLVLEVTIAALPDPERLRAWLRRVLSE